MDVLWCHLAMDPLSLLSFGYGPLLDLDLNGILEDYRTSQFIYLFLKLFLTSFWGEAALCCQDVLVQWVSAQPNTLFWL